MNDHSRLYFEGHITLEPVSGKELILLGVISTKYGMRISTFLLVKPDSSTPDAFISLRNESYTSMVSILHEACKELESYGFKIKRVKIEDTLLDTKHGDMRP